MSLIWELVLKFLEFLREVLILLGQLGKGVKHRIFLRLAIGCIDGFLLWLLDWLWNHLSSSWFSYRWSYCRFRLISRYCSLGLRNCYKCEWETICWDWWSLLWKGSRLLDGTRFLLLYLLFRNFDLWSSCIIVALNSSSRLFSSFFLFLFFCYT